MRTFWVSVVLIAGVLVWMYGRRPAAPTAEATPAARARGASSVGVFRPSDAIETAAEHLGSADDEVGLARPEVQEDRLEVGVDRAEIGRFAADLSRLRQLLFTALDAPVPQFAVPLPSGSLSHMLVKLG